MISIKKDLTLKGIILSLLGFVLFWIVLTDAWGHSSVFDIGCAKYIYAYICRVIWVIPGFVLIHLYSGSLTYSMKELFARPGWSKLTIIVFTLSALAAAFVMLYKYHGVWVNPNMDQSLELLKMVFVGVVEETVFRGWGYNALRSVTSEKKAIIISTLFFILLHWPAYFVRLYLYGSADFTMLLTQSLAAAVWGVIFCFMMKYEKSLLPPILAHIVYDILFTVFAP